MPMGFERGLIEASALIRDNQPHEAIRLIKELKKIHGSSFCLNKLMEEAKEIKVEGGN